MMGFGMLFLWPLMILVPVAVVALPVLAVAWAIRGVTPPPAQPAPMLPVATAVCPNCHRGVQAGWCNCPYCGQDLGRQP